MTDFVAWAIQNWTLALSYYFTGLAIWSFLIGMVDEDSPWKRVLPQIILWPLSFILSCGGFVTNVFRGPRRTRR